MSIARPAYFETFLSAFACAPLYVTWALSTEHEGANVFSTAARHVIRLSLSFIFSEVTISRVKNKVNKKGQS